MARVFVFYQYLYPDSNVSSIHLSELCSDLVERGWQVNAYPSNRNVETQEADYKSLETWHGVQLRRVWRPSFSRASALGRILNAAWMIARWSVVSFRLREIPDAIIIGTDPILSVFLARVWRFTRPTTLIAHWCFDLYPEAAYADGILKEDGFVSKVLHGLLKPCYGACNLIADIGPCMREQLVKYGDSWESSTMVPWALSEPKSPLPISHDERKTIFGSATLALMYSGSFGRAHSFEDMLELMRYLEVDSVRLAMSVKGQRESALRAAASNLKNVSFVPFASNEDLNDRLAATDIHVVSLREKWTGMVIPSKFFGALAIGRPVLFCGSGGSSLALWIREYGLGWVLEPGNAAEVAAELRNVIANPASLADIRERCHRVYHQHFSRQITVDRWDAKLRSGYPGKGQR